MPCPTPMHMVAAALTMSEGFDNFRYTPDNCSITALI